MISDNDLVREAVNARNNAYTPYSGFNVGAALLAEDGSLYTGVNIENAAYSPTVCAERTAFFKAVSAGVRGFSAIAVAGWHKSKDNEAVHGFAYPCGVCRQVMMEFCNPETFRVLVAESAESYRTHTLKEILPYGFGPDALS